MTHETVNDINYFLAMILPTLLILLAPFPAQLFASLVLWGSILLVLFTEPHTLDWVVVILWVLFGIPISILYTTIVNILKNIISSLFRR